MLKTIFHVRTWTSYLPVFSLVMRMMEKGNKMESPGLPCLGTCYYVTKSPMVISFLKMARKASD